MDRRARGALVAVAMAAFLSCGKTKNTGSSSASWPLAQTPAEISLQTSQPMTVQSKNTLGQYAVLPKIAVKLRVGAPWPGDLEVSLDNLPLPKETGQGAPPCTGSCIGYYKIGNIDLTTTALPLWDVVVVIPANKQPGPLVTLDVRHVSARPGATGTDLRSAPLAFSLVPAPAPAPAPPPPAPTATAHFALREGGSEHATCSKDLSWQWTPAGAAGTAFKIPDNQPFKQYTVGPVRMDNPSGSTSWYCVYKDEAPSLATGAWTITLSDPQKQIATCTVTLAAGDHWLGFSGHQSFCRLTSGWGYFEYP